MDINSNFSEVYFYFFIKLIRKKYYIDKKNVVKSIPIDKLPNSMFHCYIKRKKIVILNCSIHQKKKGQIYNNIYALKIFNLWGRKSHVCHKIMLKGFFSNTSKYTISKFCYQKCGTFNAAILCILGVYRLDYKLM